MIALAALALASTVTASHVPHIRSAVPIIAAALEDGARRSPSFRRLIDLLNASDVIVHVVWDLRDRHDIVGRLVFVTDAGTVRYVRIFVSPALRPADLVGVLGHELEHAVEIADRRWIRSPESMRAFYGIIGIPRDAHGEVFDTDDAVDAGGRIRRELSVVR